MIDFWIDFLPKLAPFWDPGWDPRAAQDGPKTTPRRSQDATKTAQEPQEHPRSNFSPTQPRLSSFLAHFNSIFGAKFALGGLESFTSNFKIQKVNG